MLKGRAGLDIDLARFQGLRNLTNEIDRQKTVAEIGAIHPDMVGKFETVFKRPAGYTAMKVFIGGSVLLLAGNGEKVGLKGDV